MRVHLEVEYYASFLRCQAMAVGLVVSTRLNVLDSFVTRNILSEWARHSSQIGQNLTLHPKIRMDGHAWFICRTWGLKSSLPMTYSFNECLAMKLPRISTMNGSDQ
jgi:hypothetical protein